MPLHHELGFTRRIRHSGHALLIEVVATAGLLFKEFERVVRPHGLTGAQFDVLMLLAYLGEGGARHGVFLFTVESWDPVRKRGTGVEDRRLLLVTDLGLVVKRNADRSHDVFVQAIDAGVDLQQLDYSALRARLVADGQILEWTGERRVLTPALDSTRLPGVVMRSALRALAAASSSMPSQAAARQTFSRTGAACSPMPPVNTSASSPPSAAASEPISRLMR